MAENITRFLWGTCKCQPQRRKQKKKKKKVFPTSIAFVFCSLHTIIKKICFKNPIWIHIMMPVLIYKCSLALALFFLFTCMGDPFIHFNQRHWEKAEYCMHRSAYISEFVPTDGMTDVTAVSRRVCNNGHGQSSADQMHVALIGLPQG